MVNSPLTHCWHARRESTTPSEMQMPSLLKNYAPALFVIAIAASSATSQAQSRYGDSQQSETAVYNSQLGYAQTGQMGMYYGGSPYAYGAGANAYGAGQNVYGAGNCGGNGQFGNNVKSSRYGFSSGQGCQTGGYWTVPTYQVVRQPAPVAQTVPSIDISQVNPIVETGSIIQSNCPDGQYRMDNGDCAIMINDISELNDQYVPPQSIHIDPIAPSVTHYPEVTTVSEQDWYQPIRK